MISKKKIEGTLVILTRNEIDGLRKIYPRIPVNRIGEVFAVDYNSIDGTINFYKKNKVRFYRQNLKGRGEAFRIAFSRAKYDNIVLFSPDGNENPDDIEKIFVLMKSGYLYFIASRFMKGGRCDEDDKKIKIRKFGNKIFTLFVNILFGGSLTDSINGFRGIKRCVFEETKPDAKGFGIEYQISMRAIKKGFKIKEIPTIEDKRISGRGTAGTFRTGLYFLKILLNEFFR